MFVATEVQNSSGVPSPVVSGPKIMNSAPLKLPPDAVSIQMPPNAPVSPSNQTTWLLPALFST